MALVHFPEVIRFSVFAIGFLTIQYHEKSPFLSILRTRSVRWRSPVFPSSMARRRRWLTVSYEDRSKKTGPVNSPFSNLSSIMFCQFEQLANARFPWTESGLFLEDFSVNVLGEPLQDQSLEQLVGLAKQGDGTEALLLRFPWFQQCHCICMSLVFEDFVAVDTVVEEA